MDRVCEYLVQGEKGTGIKYKKYKHLDISNLKQIRANRVELK